MMKHAWSDPFKHWRCHRALTWCLLVGGINLFSCRDRAARLFTSIPADQSHVHFSNTITESDSIHYFNFPYIYTGGGIGVADFDNDGWNDLFFAGNMASSKFYRNRGALDFEDLTESAGLTTSGWATGVSIVDLNQDGWMDIYLCFAGFGEAPQRRNRLFINNGDLTFTESAADYGIADEGRTTQAAFFDYDRDGDLDLYLMQHANESYAAISKLHTYADGRGPSTDKLFENTYTNGQDHPTFRDVSAKAGILTEGYGLGLAISDINRDGWPDVYIANDFIASDLLYINNGDGTFTNRLSDYFSQCSRNGMGVDIADINNDALVDILVMDMLPPDNKRQKTMTSKMNYEYFQNTLRKGFAPQFIRNTLQMNRGRRPDGQYLFSEIGRLTGLHETDWSWAPLMVDLDNDGWRDIFITNGFRRDVTDHDFQEYTEQTNAFTAGSGKLSVPDVVQKLHQLDSVHLPNYLYRNRGNLRFEDVSAMWGLDRPSMSNGSAAADLDNDGDLDLLTNNINAPASIFRNNGESHHENRYVSIRLKAPPPNRNAIGSELTAILPDGSMVHQELYPVRGYMSSAATHLHFGLGAMDRIDTLLVRWPDGHLTIHKGLTADTLHEISNGNATKSTTPPLTATPGPTLFKSVSNARHISYLHSENNSNDFRYEPLLLHQNDHFGPGIAVGDINGDGLTDCYVGAGRGSLGMFFLQEEDGTFSGRPLPGSDFYEDTGALLFDADGDGDLDLYAVSGGSSVKYFNKGHYQDRLYQNDGRGNFVWQADALPSLPSSGSCIAASDFDGDQDLDLFVGGRVLPGKFPLSPNSYLLENRGGKFIDQTKNWAPDLHSPGMVTAALWTDFDNDHDHDLLLAGEWMSLQLFENQQGRLVLQTAANLEQYTGWWNSLCGADMDRDGDIDYIAGNLGQNNALKTTEVEPVRLYAKDFDQNGTVEAIVTRFIDGKEYPIAPRSALIDQLEVINRIYPSYEAFAKADIKEILGHFDQRDMVVLEANYLKSAYIENLGNGQFEVHALPAEAQFAPIYGIEVSDFNGDGFMDILAHGNDRRTEVISGWHDGQYGLLMEGRGTNQFVPVQSSYSGFVVPGDGRALTMLPSGEKMLLLAGVNADSLQVFSWASPRDNSTFFLPGEAYAEMLFVNDSKQKVERYWGSGYLSQSAPTLIPPTGAVAVAFYERSGKERRIIRLSQHSTPSLLNSQ